jgi:cytochrome c oxidase cbb3-type subunit IV
LINASTKDIAMHMDIGLVRGTVTLVSLCVFVGIVWWTFARKNKDRFEEAAQLPFTED